MFVCVCEYVFKRFNTIGNGIYTVYYTVISSDVRGAGTILNIGGPTNQNTFYSKIRR